jgi:hypothetical protein
MQASCTFFCMQVAYGYQNLRTAADIKWLPTMLLAPVQPMLATGFGERKTLQCLKAQPQHQFCGSGKVTICTRGTAEPAA